MSTLENNLWGSDWPEVRRQWSLDIMIAHLNHGSFGAVPIPVQKVQDELRRNVESNPMKALSRDLRGQLDEARRSAAKFLGADPDGFVFVQNATTAANTALSNSPIQAGDEVLVTDQTYGAVRSAAKRICQSRKAKLVQASVPLPSEDSDELVKPILEHVTSRTRLAIIDHVASSTGLVFPIARLINELHDRNVLVLVDAAHAPGMIPVELDTLQPDFWTGNFHKWCCAPRGTAGLWIGKKYRSNVRPIITSWYDSEGYPEAFRWLGTDDYTPYLTVPAAIKFMEDLGWNRVRSHNRKLARYGRETLGTVHGIVPVKPADDRLFEAMTLLRLPSGWAESEEDARKLQSRFAEELHAEAVPISWKGQGYLRLSAQVYNAPLEYDQFAEGLKTLFDRQ